MGWEGKCRRESERMSRARGARIIGQADTLAVSSVGGPAAVQPTLRGPLVSLSLFLLVGISAVSEFTVAEQIKILFSALPFLRLSSNSDSTLFPSPPTCVDFLNTRHPLPLQQFNVFALPSYCPSS
jgi:hypothetical protein